MTKKTTGEPSEPPHTRIHPMGSLEVTDTSAAPSSSGQLPTPKIPSTFGDPPLSFKATLAFSGSPPYLVTTPPPDSFLTPVTKAAQAILPQNQKIPTMTPITIPTLPNNNTPSRYAIPTSPPFFSNTVGSHHAQMTTVTPFASNIHTNNAMIGMTIVSQPQNHQLLMAGNTPMPPLKFYH
ncbi:hypothetical protein Lser_V15G45676 [Lactuca serriola]